MKDTIVNMLDNIGVHFDGKNPWDIKVNDKRLFARLLKDKTLGAGESYVEGWWDCDQLDELFFRICRNGLDQKLSYTFTELLRTLQCILVNQQSRRKSEEVALKHYNLGNNLYQKMLGKSMAYTCGYWKNAQTLDEAEFNKYELICQKLYLKPGEKVLEIGCGWGGLAKYMAEKYQVEITCMDIGTEPTKHAKMITKGLPVTIYQCDYRDVDIYNPKKIQFDKMVSIGVLEHVGNKNYGDLMDIAHRFIKEEGIFLLHSIGGNTSKNHCEAWIDKYIFPHGMLPSLKQLGEAFENRFVVEDLHNFGAYYDKTLLAWFHNLESHWHEFRNEYDEKTFRMMKYYLLSCAGAFRARSMQLWQFILTPKGLLNGYTSVR